MRWKSFFIDCTFGSNQEISRSRCFISCPSLYVVRSRLMKKDRTFLLPASQHPPTRDRIVDGVAGTSWMKLIIARGSFGHNHQQHKGVAIIARSLGWMRSSKHKKIKQSKQSSIVLPKSLFSLFCFTMCPFFCSRFVRKLFYELTISKFHKITKKCHPLGQLLPLRRSSGSARIHFRSVMPKAWKHKN